MWLAYTLRYNRCGWPTQCVTTDVAGLHNALQQMWLTYTLRYNRCGWPTHCVTTDVAGLHTALQQMWLTYTLRYNRHARRQAVTQQSDIHHLPSTTDSYCICHPQLVTPRWPAHITTCTLIHAVRRNARCQPKENNTLSYNVRGRTHGQSDE
jgi:hypothetical protein